MSVRIDEHTDHMKYTEDMEAIDSDIMDRVIAEMQIPVLLKILKRFFHRQPCRFWKKSQEKPRWKPGNISVTPL